MIETILTGVGVGCAIGMVAMNRVEIAKLKRDVIANQEEYSQAEIYRLSAFNALQDRVNSIRPDAVSTKSGGILKDAAKKRPRTMTELREMTEEWAAKEGE